MTKSRDTADILEDVKVDGNVTAVGQETLKDNTGTHNTGVGYRSMFNSSLSGSFNVALGNYILYANISGAYNTALGYQSLFSNSTASNNTAVGYQAGYSGTTAFNNAYFGIQAGYSATTGQQNTFIGRNAGYHVTTGSKNSILGTYTGNQGGLDIRTSSNNIVLSDGDGNPRLFITPEGRTIVGDTSNTGATINVSTSSGIWGISIKDTANNQALMRFLSTSNTQVGSISHTGTSTSYNTSSDHRLKENVDYTWDATTRLKQLKPARFNFIADDTNTLVDGFLAHEAQAVVPEAVTGTHNEVDDDGNAVMQGIDQSKLVPLLVKTIQELEARITALEA